MSYPKWQEEVLYGGHNRMVVRAPRQAGKTTVAIEWARNAGGRVLYIAPYKTMARQAYTQMAHEYDITDEIQSVRDDAIEFRDGTKVIFAGADNLMRLRGLSVNAVVFDEAGYLDEETVISALSRIMHRGYDDAKVLALYSGRTEDAIERLLDSEGVKQIVVDYLDLLEEGFFSATYIRNLQKTVPSGTFKKEMGPFYRERPQTNKRYSYLLSQEA